MRNAPSPESGLLGYRLTLEGLNPTVIQYWRSKEELYAYAADRSARHRPAWAEFNRRAAEAPGAVGIWHETYVVPAGHHESIYGDMPPFGLGRAYGTVPLGAGAGARDRLKV